VEVENEEIEKETSTETGKQREQPWREEKNFNCQGNPKRTLGRTAYIAGTIRLRSCLLSGTELGTKQLGSQWDHISTTASVGRNKMASAIRLLFHPRGRDRPYFILLPRFRSSKRTPCSLSVVQSAKTTAMLFSCLLRGSLTTGPPNSSREFVKIKKELHQFFGHRIILSIFIINFRLRILDNIKSKIGT